MCLSIIWNWLGDNAGQIQIIIAIVALIYARKAFLKVLEQIDISRDQDNEAYSQRNYELKIEVLNHYLKMSNALNLNLTSLHEFVHGIDNTLSGENTEEQKQDLEQLLITVNEKIKQSEELKAMIFESSKAIIATKDFDYKKMNTKLNDIYTALLLLTNESEKLELLKTMYLIESN